MKRSTPTGAGEGNRGKTDECKSLLSDDVASPPHSVQHNSLHGKAAAPEN